MKIHNVSNAVQPITLSDLMPSDALSYSSQLFYASNPYCFALKKDVEVKAMEAEHQQSEYFIGCIVAFIH